MRVRYVPRCQVCGDRMAPRKQAPFLCPDCKRREQPCKPGKPGSQPSLFY